MQYLIDLNVCKIWPKHKKAAIRLSVSPKLLAESLLMQEEAIYDFAQRKPKLCSENLACRLVRKP